MATDDVSPTFPNTRWAQTAAPRGDAYDRRWDQISAAGGDPHGEASFVMRFAPSSVLDAGCGTGRVARELARRGVAVVGVDVDADMLATAVRKAPELTWHQQDLATLELRAPDAGRSTFDVVVLAGNVMIFVRPGTEATVVRSVASHIRPGGHLIAGFQLQPGRLDLAAYDRHAAAAGLLLRERCSTWSGDPFADGNADYAVSVHTRPAP